MSGVTLDVLYTDNELRRRIKALKKALSREHFGPLLETIGETVKNQTMLRFERGVDPSGQAWPISLRAKMEDGQTLVNRGRLRDSVTYALAIDKSGVEVGTNTVYAAIHQIGGFIRAKSGKGLRFQVGGRWVTKQSVTIPARPYLGVNTQDEGDIKAAIDDWAAQRLTEIMQ